MMLLMKIKKKKKKKATEWFDKPCCIALEAVLVWTQVSCAFQKAPAVAGTSSGHSFACSANW